MPGAKGPLGSARVSGVQQALREDIGDGDRTAALIPAATRLQTQVLCRQQAVLAGAAWFDETFRQLDPSITISWQLEDGQALHAGQEICRLEGPARAILSAERVALNFLQTLSATATQTRRYVDAIAGTEAVILDTRKTLPGLRLAQKYAVRCGGGHNHRVGLFDAILIKENHIAAAGSISAAVRQARQSAPELLLEVEVEDLEQLEEACRSGAQRALLDNFGPRLLREAVRGFKGKIGLEASGGITLDSVRAVAETGVDFISTGDLTKNIQAVDFSMRFLS
ncbi:MAG: carboxylating nicotinate-nucleotide diphosphorylase [Xanthomonadales bacterium]|nr:carboxylating nicotinate-nucleotide diphosphorylase [Xanthomonadales bacterium]